jgi:hypothetical protein
MVRRALCLLCALLLSLTAQAAIRTSVLATPDGWLLQIESDEPASLDASALLSQFVVGRISSEQLGAPDKPLYRWTIPLAPPPGRTAPERIPPLRLGAATLAALSLPTPSPAAQPAGNPAAQPRPQADQSQSQTLSGITQEATLSVTGPLYVGQPVIYQLVLWLPANLQTPRLDELQVDGMQIRRLGEDSWRAPLQPGGSGQLIRRWLVQPRHSGTFTLSAPLLTATEPLPGGATLPVQSRANDLTLSVRDTPSLPVARSLTLTEERQPDRPLQPGEPLIRTLILRWRDGDLSTLTLPTPSVAGLKVLPDGQQEEEHFLASGELTGERRIRQAISAERPGHYQLPAIDLRWLDTQGGEVRQLHLPSQSITFNALPAAGSAHLPGVLDVLLMALALHLLLPRLRRLGSVLGLVVSLGATPESARSRWRTWSSHALPASVPQPTGLAEALTALERACFDPSWQQEHDGSAAAFRRALLRHISWLMAPRSPAPAKESALDNA